MQHDIVDGEQNDDEGDDLQIADEGDLTNQNH